jgi:hypothetical protein
MLIGWLSSGCEPYQSDTAIRVIQNRSIHGIFIVSYLEDSVLNEINLQTGESTADTVYGNPVSTPFLGHDSVNVIFDDSLLVAHHQVADAVDRHLMVSTNWQYEVLEEDRFGRLIRYQYIFTDADFEEALEKGRKVE